MIKLTKEEQKEIDFVDLEYGHNKADAIYELWANKYPNTKGSVLLKLTQAILDGKWEVEKAMTLDEFKEEYKLLKCEYNKMRLDGDITANRVYQEAVIELVEEFLEEV